MVTLQIPGMISASKFLLVATIWLLIVFGFAAVIGGVNRQWTAPSEVLNPLNNNRGDQCEALNYKPGTTGGAVLEPENTWSNAAYLLAGMLVLSCTKRPLGYLVGLQLCVLAILSAGYHATLQDGWRELDVAGIYFILTGVLFYAVQSSFVHGLSAAAEWIVALLLSIVSFVGGYLMAHNRTKSYFLGSSTVTFTFVCALVVICTFEMGRQGFDWGSTVQVWRLWVKPGSPPVDYLKFWRMFSWRDQTTDWNLVSYFTFFVFIGAPGIICRLLDGDGKPLCSPGSPIQPHAVWHTFGAATLLIAYDLFAWRSGWAREYPVFQRVPPESGRVNTFTLYGTAIAATLLGGGLFVLSFIPGVFVDSPRMGDSVWAPRSTGITIASVFLVLALTLFILRLAGVLKNPETGPESHA